MKLYGKAHETAHRILDAFQRPETLPKAIAPIFIHRKDDIPCRKWSWRNQLLAALAGTHDARGFRQWQAAGRHVRKGAKAFTILSPCTKKISEEDGEERYAVYGFKGTAVFRIEDTEGEDVTTGDAAVDNWIASLPLRAVAEAWDITIATYDGEDAPYRGYFRQATDGDRKAIALGVQDALVFFHELMHAADYRLGNASEKGQHWRKEIVAEFGAAVLAECLDLDIDAKLGNAYEYLQAYAKDADKTVNDACMECLDRICQAVALVLDTAESLQDEPAPAC